MKKTIIIHMGAHKTGTTILQDTLFKNNDILSRYGVEYLDMQDGVSNHVINFMPIVDRELKSWIFCEGISGEYFVSSDRAAAVKQKLYDIFIIEYNRFLKSENINTLIISAEGFEYWGIDDFEYVKEFLQDNAQGIDIEIKPVLYVRKVNDYINSTIQEYSKTTTQYLFNDENCERFNNLYDYDELITNLELTYGREHLFILKYDRSSLYKSSIIDDFLLKVLNIEIKEQLVVSKVANQSLSMNETILRSEYSKKYNKKMILLSELANYKNIEKIDNDGKFLINIQFDELNTDRINNSIIKINEYLDKENQFNEVKVSKNKTKYPTLTDIDIEYLKGLKLFIEKTLVEYDSNKTRLDKIEIESFNNELQEIIEMRLELTGRIGVYFFFDKDGIVDKFVTYMLDDLVKNLDRLVIVVNGSLKPESRDVFTRYTKDVIVRENIGLDVGAYKEAIEYIGWDNLYKTEELILLNSTIYGPIYPFENMFAEMNNKQLDFWGITKHHELPFDPFGTCAYGYVPEHIQSHFIAIRGSLLKSYEYKKMWDEMPVMKDYKDSVGMYETVFTKKFEDKGFVWDVYIDSDDLSELTPYPLMYTPVELIKNRKCPIIKRRSFFNDYYDVLNNSMGENALEIMEYLKTTDNYDADMIWENLIRNYNMYDLVNLMQLDYILPYELSRNNNEQNKRVALVLHVYNDDLIGYCCDYAKNMPDYADIFITTDTEEKINLFSEYCFKENIKNVQFRLIQNRGRDVSALLVGVKDVIFNYDYVCFAHDKKTKQLQPQTIGLSFAYNCFENVLGSKDYVMNIINMFDENPRLGMLTPPPPKFGPFFALNGTTWTVNYENTVNLAKDLELNINLDSEKEPIAPLGTMFWFRPEALRVLFEYDWDYSDFPPEPNGVDGSLLHAIERIYGFVPQHHGFYTAKVMSTKVARILYTNNEFALEKISSVVRNNFYFYSLPELIVVLNEKLQRSARVGSQKAMYKKNKVLVSPTTRLKIKKALPEPIFVSAVNAKRFLLGPRNLKGNY